MDQYWRARSSLVLWALLLLALAQSLLLFSFGPLITGEPRFDGALAVIVGLYVCSHPASNVLDLLFAEGGVRRSSSAHESGIFWYLLNMLVMIAGWLAVYMGIVQYTTRP